MSSYYYVLASLPHIDFESKQFPDPADFLDLCRLFLPEHDMKIIESVTLHPQPDTGQKTDAANDLLEKFRHREIGLRNELAKQRSQILNRETVVRMNSEGSDCTAVTGLADSVKLIMQAATPLEADAELDRLRWQYLDELGSGQYFNLEQVIVYYFRLHILIRRRSLTSDAGMEAYRKQYETIMAGAEYLKNGEMNGVRE